MTGPIGRIILERADRSGYYALPWDSTLAVALLAGGSLSVRSGGNAYSFTGSTTPPVTTDPPVLAIQTAPVSGSLGSAALTTAPNTAGGTLIWLPNTETDTPPTMTVDGKPYSLEIYEPVAK